MGNSVRYLITVDREGESILKVEQLDQSGGPGEPNTAETARRTAAANGAEEAEISRGKAAETKTLGRRRIHADFNLVNRTLSCPLEQCKLETGSFGGDCAQ